MNKFINKKFTKLTVIEKASGKTSFYICKCDCGNMARVLSSNLSRGNSKSCGCLKKISQQKRLIPGTNFITTVKNIFYANVLISQHSNCLEWIGSLITYKNYGIIMIGGKKLLAHRLSYQIFNGEIPPNKIICHHCDNTKCVSPDHLFIGTAKENNQDKINKNRGNYYKLKNRLKLIQVINIQNMIKEGQSTAKIAEKYKVSFATILRIKKKAIKNKSSKHID